MTTFFFAAAVAALLVAAGASITRVQHILADLAEYINQSEVSK